MRDAYKRVRVDQYDKVAGVKESQSHFRSFEEVGKVLGAEAEAGGHYREWVAYPAPGYKLVVECGEGEVDVEFSTPSGTSHRLIPYSQIRSYLRGLCRWS